MDQSYYSIHRVIHYIQGKYKKNNEEKYENVNSQINMNYKRVSSMQLEKVRTSLVYMLDIKMHKLAKESNNNGPHVFDLDGYK